MTAPNAPRSLKRVWIGVLVFIVLAWIVYALTGGTKTPETTSIDSVPPGQQR